LAAINPVLRHPVERAAGQRLAAPVPTRSAGPALAGDAVRGELILQQPHRAQCQIAAKDVAHDFGFDADRRCDASTPSSTASCTTPTVPISSATVCAQRLAQQSRQVSLTAPRLEA